MGFSRPDDRLKSQQFDIRPSAGFANLTRDAYKDDLLGLFEAGEEVASLLTHPGMAHVQHLIDLEVTGLDRKLDGKALDTIQEYAYGHGRRGGLLAFTEAAHAIVAVAEKQRAEQQRKHEGAAEPAPIGA